MLAPSSLDNVEHICDYEPDGLHPVVIGDVLAQGRYRIVHKMGHGGRSTVWMARSSESGKLVALKVLGADVSSKPIDNIPELAIPSKLSRYVRKAHITVPPHFQTIQDYFKEDGPNGSHLCLVSELEGPSILSMLRCPGRGRGNRRVRGDLARKLAKQVVCAVELMHSAGLVHGEWSDEDVYIKLGQPETEKLTCVHTLLPANAPTHLTAPVDMFLIQTIPLQEDIVLIDFGQSFDYFHPPSDYCPATVLHYQCPEGFFENKIGMPADIWSLACTIFEIRAGFPLFDNFFYDEPLYLQKVVSTLGKFPKKKWWDSFKDRHEWFNEDGELKALELQPRFFPARKMSIKQYLKDIGTQDAPPEDDGPMIERAGTRLGEHEIEVLGDLLGKMLRYRPEDRIKVGEVISHPWFSLE